MKILNTWLVVLCFSLNTANAYSQEADANTTSAPTSKTKSVDYFPIIIGSVGLASIFAICATAYVRLKLLQKNYEVI